MGLGPRSLREPKFYNFTTKLAGPISEVGRANSGATLELRAGTRSENDPVQPRFCVSRPPTSDARPRKRPGRRPLAAAPCPPPSSPTAARRLSPGTLALPAPLRTGDLGSGRSQQTPAPHPAREAGRDSPAAESTAPPRRTRRLVSKEPGALEKEGWDGGRSAHAL